MKKTRCLVFAFIFPSMALSQTPSFQLGVEAGPSLAWLRGNPYLAQRASPGLSAEAGVAILYNATEQFSLRLVPGYARRGSRFSLLLTDHMGRPTGETHQFTDLNYFTLPVLLRSGVGHKIRGFIDAGVYVAWLTGFSDGFVKSSGIHIGGLDLYRSFDAGVAWGLGLQVPTGKRCTFSIECRHNLGLYDINDPTVFSDGSIKTNTLVLLLQLDWRLSN